MNRQERRRLGIKRKEPIINLRKEDIQNMKEEAVGKGVRMAFTLMLALPTMVIHDHFGELMRKDGREKRFVALCMEQYKCYEEGYVGLEELHKLLKEEADVDIEP